MTEWAGVPKGAKVGWSDYGRSTFPRRPDRYGTYRGLSKGFYLRVRWRGLVSESVYHPDFIKLIERADGEGEEPR